MSSPLRWDPQTLSLVEAKLPDDVLRVLEVLGPDLTAHEWASQLGVDLRDLIDDCKRRGIRLKEEE